MNKIRNKKKNKKFKIYIRIIVLITITLIGCYGIIRAPKSDTDILERELAENEKALQQSLQQTNSPQPEISEPPETSAPAPEPETTPSEPSSDETGEDASSQTEAPQATSSLTSFPDSSSEDEPDKTGKDISVIGDSVFLGASPSFKEIYKDAVIDAKVSRQVSKGIDVAKELNKNGQLGSTVIIALGTNGNFNEATGQELIDYLGADRTIYWINAYGKKLDIQDDVNKTIKDLADKNDNVHLISWAKKAKKHSDWFYQDGIHLNSEGQKGYAEFVSEAIEGGE